MFSLSSQLHTLGMVNWIFLDRRKTILTKHSTYRTAVQAGTPMTVTRDVLRYIVRVSEALFILLSQNIPAERPEVPE